MLYSAEDNLCTGSLLYIQLLQRTSVHIRNPEFSSILRLNHVKLPLFVLTYKIWQHHQHGSKCLLIAALWKLRQEDLEFKGSPSYIMRLCLKNKQKPTSSNSCSP
jgi:hypothetical protein